MLSSCNAWAIAPWVSWICRLSASSSTLRGGWPAAPQAVSETSSSRHTSSPGRRRRTVEAGVDGAGSMERLRLLP